MPINSALDDDGPPSAGPSKEKDSWRQADDGSSSLTSASRYSSRGGDGGAAEGEGEQAAFLLMEGAAHASARSASPHTCRCAGRGASCMDLTDVPAMLCRPSFFCMWAHRVM